MESQIINHYNEIIYNFQNYWKMKRKYIGYLFVLFSCYVTHRLLCHMDI